MFSTFGDAFVILGKFEGFTIISEVRQYWAH